MKSTPGTPIFEWTKDWALENEVRLAAFETIASTNTAAKDDEAAESRPLLTSGLISEPTLYLTREQTAGRGRGDHVWTMPQSGAFLGSWCFALARVPQPIFSALMGLALYEAALATWPEVAWNIKAPNDLFIAGKKTAGILIETVDQGSEKRTVIGVGFNVASKPSGLDTATCLEENSRRAISQEEWNSFLDAWLVRLKDGLREGQYPALTATVTDRLKDALNRHPLLKEPILNVDAHGQLHSASRVIHWHEL